jgi:hypothetical protein
VNLGGISFSECGSATISFPFNMRFPHYTALLHHKRWTVLNRRVQ